MIKRITAFIICAVMFLSSQAVFADDIDVKSEPVENEVTVPILLYHALEENYPDEISNLAITTDMFEAHMKALSEAGYNTIFFSEYMDYKYNGTPLPEKPIIITFDDGYVSNFIKAYPILRTYKMKATIFIVASTVGLSYPDVNYAHFTWTQAKQMQNSGLVEIGSHTYWHNDVSQYTDDMAIVDLRMSKYLIDTNLDYNCTLLAFPYGLCTEENQQQALDAGYELSCKVGDVGVNTKDTPITGLKRLTIYGTYTPENVLHYIDVETEKELSGYFDNN